MFLTPQEPWPFYIAQIIRYLLFLKNFCNYILYYRYGWQPRGDVLASRGGQCAAVLVYTVKLVKPGAVKYTYQFTDDNIIFEFQVRNNLNFMFMMIQYLIELCYTFEMMQIIKITIQKQAITIMLIITIMITEGKAKQKFALIFFPYSQAQDKECQSIDDGDDYKWPPITREGQWQTRTVKLKPGLNVLHWKTIGIEAGGSSRPVMIKSIQISGKFFFFFLQQDSVIFFIVKELKFDCPDISNGISNYPLAYPHRCSTFI